MRDKLAFYVDYNARERLPDGGQAVLIRSDRMNPPALEQELKAGLRIVTYDEEIRCEGILRKGYCLDGWVADLIPETNLDLKKGEFERLRIMTKRQALRIAK